MVLDFILSLILINTIQVLPQSHRSKRSVLQKMEAKIGEQEDRITSRATQRGTAFHALAEDYFKGEIDIDRYLENNPLSVRMFQSSQIYAESDQ